MPRPRFRWPIALLACFALLSALALACGGEPSTHDALRQAFTPDPETEQVERYKQTYNFSWRATAQEAPHLYETVPCPRGLKDPRGLARLPGAGCIQGQLENPMPFTLERVRVICQNEGGVKSELLFPHDPAPGETTEWTWVNAPLEADFTCLIDWLVPAEAMQE